VVLYFQYYLISAIILIYAGFGVLQEILRDGPQHSLPCCEEPPAEPE